MGPHLVQCVPACTLNFHVQEVTLPTHVCVLRIEIEIWMSAYEKTSPKGGPIRGPLCAP